MMSAFHFSLVITLVLNEVHGEREKLHRPKLLQTNRSFVLVLFSSSSFH